MNDRNIVLLFTLTGTIMAAVTSLVIKFSGLIENHFFSALMYPIPFVLTFIMLFIDPRVLSKHIIRIVYFVFFICFGITITLMSPYGFNYIFISIVINAIIFVISLICSTKIITSRINNPKIMYPALFVVSITIPWFCFISQIADHNMYKISILSIIYTFIFCHFLSCIKNLSKDDIPLYPIFLFLYIPNIIMSFLRITPRRRY